MLIYLGSVTTTYLVFEGDQVWRVGSFPFPIYTMIKGQAKLTKEWLFITTGHQGHLQWRSNLETIEFTWIANTSEEIKQKQE